MRYLDIVRDEHTHHRLGGVCHEDASFEARLFREVREGGAMVRVRGDGDGVLVMGVRDDKDSQQSGQFWSAEV